MNTFVKRYYRTGNDCSLLYILRSYTHGCNSGTYIMYMCTFIFKLSKKKIHGKESYFYFLKYLFKIVHNGNSQRVFYQYEQIMNPVYQISNSRIRRPKF